MIKLTAHAEEVMSDRAILLDWVVAAIENPDSQSSDPRDPRLTRSYLKIYSENERILRVVHRKDGSDILIITAHFDRGMKL
jgi:hypothetical protein